MSATTTTGAFGIGAADDQNILEINTTSSGKVDFTLSKVPDPLNGKFNSLQTLADAINNTHGLTARVTDNYLYVSSQNANDAVTFTNVPGPNFVGGTSVDIKASLGLVDVFTGSDTFNTLQGLSNVIATKTGITSSISSTASNPQMKISATDPLQSIEFLGNPIPAPSHVNKFINPTAGPYKGEFGITDAVLPPIYNSQNVGGNNMASGKITPSFSSNITLFDGLGIGHDFTISTAKIANNQWAVELYATNPNAIISTRSDGLVASGTITFNGDGSLRDVSSTLLSPISISWQNQAVTSSINLNFGTAGQPLGTVGATEIGKTDGMTQFSGGGTAGKYNDDVRFITQDGAGAGLLTSVSIDKNGIISFNYSNGQTRPVYQMPFADFPNIDGLTPTSGNAYTQSDHSGALTLKQAGQSGEGVIAPASLENSGTELSNELTSMIIAQRSYEANTKTITTVDKLLQDLTNILQ